MLPNRTIRGWVFLGALAILANSIAPIGLAATIVTWNDSGADWATGINWVGNIAPADDLVTNIAEFSSASYTYQPTITAANRSVNGISGTGAGAVTLGGNKIITLGDGGITLGSGAGNFTIASTLGVTLGAAQSWTNNSSNLLWVGGAVTNGANLLTIAGNGNTLISGIIGSGSGGLQKDGTGTLTLSGANAFTGGFVLNAGTVNINNAAALGAASGTFTINGGRFDNTSGAAVVATTAGAMTWTANATFLGSSALTLPGALALDADRTITVQSPGLGVNTNALTLSGILSGANSFTKAGSGSLILTGANTFGGTGKSLTLAAGTLVANHASNPVFGAAGTTLIIQGGALDAAVGSAPANNLAQQWDGDFAFLGTNTLNLGNGAVALGSGVTRQVAVLASTLTVGGAIAGSSSNLVKTGGGTMVLSGLNTYTGTTTVSAGTLQFNANTMTAYNTSGVSFAGTGNLVNDNTGATAAITRSVTGGLNFAAGDGEFRLTRTAAQNMTVSFSSGASRAVGAVGFFSTITNTPSWGTTSFATLSGMSTGFMGAGYFAAQNAGSSTFGYYDATSNTVRTMNYGTDPNTATVGAAADVGANANKVVRTTGTISAQGTINLASLHISGNNAFTLTGGATLTLGGLSGAEPGGILKTGNGSAILSGGSAITSGGNEIVFRSDASGDSLAVNTPITGSGVALTKSGPGTLILGGAVNTAVGGSVSNTFDGGVFLNAGTLQINSSSAPGGNGAAGALNGNPITVNSGTLALCFDGDGTGTPASINLASNVTLNASAAITANLLAAGNPISATPTLYKTPQNKTLQFGSLAFNNPGTTLTVTPSNGYGVEFTGTATLNQNFTTLNVANTQTSRAVPGLTLSGRVTGVPTGGVWTKAGAGTLALNNGTSDFVANIQVSGGVLAFNSDGAATGANTPLGDVSNDVFLNGTTATLRAYGGTSGSPLAISLNSGRTITFNNPTVANNVIEVTGNTTLTINSPFGLANNGFTKGEAGTLVLNADNGAWSGAINILAGAVRVANNGALGLSSGATTVPANSGAALQLAGVSISEPLTLNNVGINNAGALEAFTGTNAATGLITLASATSIGADAGATLNIRGGISGSQTLAFVGSGTINVDTTALSAIGAITKAGSGTTTLSVASPAFIANLTVNGGTFALGGAGAGAGSIGGTGTVTVNPGAVLSINDSVGSPVANRLGNRAATLQGGEIVYTGNAASSSETIGALTPGAGNGIVTIAATGSGQANVLAASVGTVAAGSTVLFRGTGLGNAAGGGVATFATTTAPTFVGVTAANVGLANKGILPWALIDSTATGLGTSFATTNGTAGALFRPLAANEYATTVTGGANIALSSSETVSGSTSVNSLKLGNAGGIAIAPMQTLTVGSGGILALDGNAGISGGMLTVGAAQLYFHTPTATPANTTNVASTVLGTGGITKAGDGTLALNSVSPLTGQITINQGTLKLNAGVNTLAVGVGQTGQPLVVNAGGKLDLNGNTQLVGTLSSTAAAANATVAGGAITSSVGTGTFVTSTASSTFAGSITGNVNFMRSGTGVFNILNPQTYGGATVFNGGGITRGSTLAGVTLTDFGALPSTSSIKLNYTSLNLNNTSTTRTDSDSRLDASTPIELNGGGLHFFGRVASLSSQSVGQVTLTQGLSFISAVNQSNLGQLPCAATLALAGLTRNAANGATLQFAQNWTNNSSGQYGLLVDGNGRSQNILIASPPSLTNNLIGGWAVVSAGYFAYDPLEFASYLPTVGVGPLNRNGFAGYDAVTLTGSTSAKNVRLTASATAPTGTTFANSLHLLNATALTNITLTFTNASDQLVLTSGGLLVQNLVNGTSGAAALGAAANSGQITSAFANGTGSNDLFLFYNNSTAANVLTLNSVIVDNGATPVRLVVSGSSYNNANNITLQGTNTYSGGTVINGEILMVGATGTLPAPTSGTGITINGGTLQQTAGGVIAPQSVVMNGGSSMSLAGNNSLTSLTFNNNGGNAPNITTTGGILTLTGDITASSMNAAGPSVITAGTIDLGAATRTITVNPVTFDGTPSGTVISPYTAGLNIVAVLQNTAASIIKAGAGNLQLGGANTFGTAGSTGVDLQAGGLILNANAALGTGTLLVSGNNTSISASATLSGVANAITLSNGVTNITLGNYAASAMTLSGPIAWSTGAGVVRTVTVNAVTGSTFNAQTISGAITSAGSGNGIIKQGLGTLALTGNNSATLDWTGAQAIQINNGTLQINADTALGVAPASPVANNIVIDGGVFSDSTNATLNVNRGITLGGATTAGVIDVAATQVFTIPGVITGGTLVKAGTGTLALTGANAHTGGTDIVAGTLSFASGSLNTTGSIVMDGGTLQWATGNAQDVSTGGRLALVAGKTAIFDTNGNDVALGAAFVGSNSGGIAKIGTGKLTLSSANSYTGGTTITAGTLAFVIGAIGSTGPITMDGGTLQWAAGNTQDISTGGRVAFIAGKTATLDTNGNDVTLATGIGGGTNGVLTKVGAGRLTLTGANTYTGNTNVNAGTIVFDTGSSVATAKLLVGYGSGLAGAVVQNNGSIAIGLTTSGQDVLSLGGTGGYGYYRMNAGTLSTGQLAFGGNSAGAGTTAVFDQYGGATSVAMSVAGGWLVFGWQGTNPNGVLNIRNGAFTNGSTTNNTTMGFAANAGSFGMINLLGSGASVDLTGGGTARSVNLAANNGNVAGVLNLNGGTLKANSVMANNAVTTPSYLNFNGGTLQANSANATFINNLTAATIYSGGATIDTQSNNVTIPQAISAPAGNGVTSISVANGGAGYIGAPAVRITGGGGTGATAIAVVDLDPLSANYGKVTGIEITSAGKNYTSNPTFTLYGGGASTAATLGTPVLGGVLGGGLTKVGSGTLTLSGTNTYAGKTTISAGTLSISSDANLGAAPAGATAGHLVIDSGTTLAATADMTLNPNRGIALGPASGSGAATIDVASGKTLTYEGIAADNGGTGSLIKSGAGTLTLGGANSYTGTTSVTAGTLNLAGSLGNAAVSVADGAALSGKGAIGTGKSGSLTLGATTGAILRVDGSTPGALQVNGNVTLNGTNNIYLDGVGGAVNTLFSYSGTLSGTAANLVLANASGYRPGYSISVGTGTNSSATITLNISSLTWSGTNSAAWDTTTANWNSGTENYYQADIVTFNDSASGNYNVTLAGTVTPFSITYGNTAKAYSLSGAGSIGGSAALLVNGGGIVTISTANTFTGGTTLSGSSTLQIGSNTALGTGTITLNSGKLSSDSATARSLSNNLVIGGAVTLGDSVTNGTLAFSGTVDLGGATRNITTPSGVAMSGVVSNGGLTKDGVGTLTVSGANYFAGPLTVVSGALSIATINNAGANGPLGNSSGAVTLGGSGTTGTLQFTGTTASSNKPITLAAGGTGAFQVDSAADSLTLSGTIDGGGSLAATGAGTLVLSGANSFGGSVTVNAGTLQAVGAASLNSRPATLNGGSLALLADGNGLGASETIVYGNNVSLQADAMITVGHTAAAANALNKTIQEGTLSFVGNQTLTVTNNNGYGLEFAGNVSLSGTTTTFNVVSATASNVVQGLTLSGVVSGGSGVVKTGAGTLVLGNATNAFGGVGALIDISGGIVSVGSDSALGDAANQIRLNVNASTGVGLRATGTFATSRTITLNQASNAIEVTSGNTLTINSAFGLGAATNALAKNDDGTLVLTANNSGWDGALTVNAGAVRVTNANALGSATGGITVNNASGAAIQLDGGGPLAISEPLTLTGSGIQSGGALQSVAGANSLSGAITLAAAASLGVDGGSTLTLSSGAAISGTTALTVTGAGNGVVNSIIGNGAGGLVKLGSGTWELTAANTGTGVLTVYGSEGTSTLRFSGAGKWSGAGTNLLGPGSTVVLDNSAAAVNNRLNTRPTYVAGNLTIIGNADTAVAELFGTNFHRSGGASVFTLVAADTAGVTVGASGFNKNAGVSMLIRGDNLGGAAGAGTANFTVVLPTIGQAGAVNMPNRAIVPWALVDNAVTGNGTSFAAWDATNGVQALTSNDYVTTWTTVNAPNVVLAGAATAAKGTNLINSLTLNTGGSVLLPATGSLQLDSGGLLAKDSATIDTSGPAVLTTTSNRELVVHTVGAGTVLTINPAIAGTTGGLVKADAGTLQLGSAAYYSGATSINGGTLKLVAGATNTLLYNNALNLNFGGTLDLNGGVQYVGTLQSAPGNTEAAQVGGTVVSSDSMGTLLVRMAADTTFAGWIGAAGKNSIYFAQAGNNALSLTQRSTYTGATLVMGGTMTLKDNGVLANTSAVDVNCARFNIDNTGLLGINGTASTAGRINPSSPINVRSANFMYYGRAQTASTEYFNSLNLVAGNTEMNMTLGGTGVNSAELTFGALTQANNATMNLRFAGAAGSARRLFFGNGMALLQNNILPAWIEYGGSDFASYSATLGAGYLGAAGYPTYDGTALPTSNQPTFNINLTSAGVVPSGGLTLNTLKMANQNVSFANGADTLTLVAGGLLRSNGSPTLGSTPDEGRVTAVGTGTVPLYVHSNGGGTLIINSRLVDTADGGSLRLVATLYNSGVVSLADSLNSYSGGTVVNGWGGGTTGTLNVAATGKLPAGGLIINNATVTQTAGGVIDSSNEIILNGNAVFTLANQGNALARLTFNNFGGATAPTVNTTGVLTLPGGTSIAAASSNPGSTATINGTLDYTGASSTPVIFVDPISVNSENVAPWQPALSVVAVIQNSTQGINKSGNGVLQLSGASTFTGGVNLTAGGIAIGANSTPSTAGSIVTSGPLGTGTLTIGFGTSVLSSGTYAVANPVVVGGDFAFNGVSALTLNGAVSLPASATTNVTVTAPQMTATLGGVVSGSSAGLNKLGLGTLVLSGANTFSGATTVGAGTLTLGNSSALQNSVYSTDGVGALSFGTLVNATFGGLQGSGNLTLSNASSGNVTLNVGNNNGSTSFSGVLSGNGGITKVGTGTLTLNAANAYTGDTAVAAGTLVLAHQQAIQSSTLAMNTADAGTLNFSVPSVTLGGLKGTRNLNLGTAAVSIGYNNEDTAYSGVLSGGNGLTKIGAGALTLTGANAYNGPTIINEGTIRLTGGPTAGLKIMPLGDSITYGSGGTNAGYRGPLYSLLTNGSYAFQFVGSTNGNAGSLPTSPINQTYHEGHGGWRTGDEATGILHGVKTIGDGGLGWLSVNPDLVLLHIGTNNTGLSEPQSITDIGSILDQIHTQRPTATTIVAQIIPKIGSMTWVSQYNSDLVGMIASKRAAGYNVFLADLNTTYPANSLPDNVHPNNYGYSWMADQWYGAILSDIVGGSKATAAIPDNSAVTIGGSGTLALAGSQETIGPLSGSGRVDLGSDASALLTINNTLGNNSAFSGAISGSGGLVKMGPSALTLSGANTYSGTTTVQEGTLIVNGTHVGGGAYTILSGGTLGGSGTISANVTVNAGGFLSPGNSPGMLTISGNVTQFGTLLVEVDTGATPVVDLLNVSGTYDITIAAVSFNVTGSLSGDYIFVDYGTLSGTQYATVQNLPAGYTIDYAYGGDTKIALVPVPEPATIAGLATIGLIGAAGGWWRQRLKKGRRISTRAANTVSGPSRSRYRLSLKAKPE